LLELAGVAVDDPAPDWRTYGIIYGVRRTTIYLSDDLKTELTRAAHEEGRTEADLVREGVERLLRAREPEPRLPLFASGKSDLAENVDKLLAGFGER
jgi:hypothetical protein